MTEEIALIRRLHKHRVHANRLLLAAASALDLEQLLRTFPIGQGSVWRSLVHLYAAEYVWLGALLGDPRATLPGEQPGMLPGSGASTTEPALDDLRARWAELDVRWSAYLERLTPDELPEPVARVNRSAPEGRPLVTSRANVLLHVALHAHYTAAQTVNMLRQLGVTPIPDLMLISLARSEHPDNS